MRKEETATSAIWCVRRCGKSGIDECSNAPSVKWKKCQFTGLWLTGVDVCSTWNYNNQEKNIFFGECSNMNKPASPLEYKNLSSSSSGIELEIMFCLFWIHT